MNQLTDIQKLFAESGSVVSTKYLTDNGISRYLIAKYLKQNVIEKVGYGKFCLNDSVPDEFFKIQLRSEKIVFSYSTALYFHNLTDKIPMTYDVTVPQGYNVSKIKRDFPNIDFYYSKADLWAVGLEKTVTPFGFEVNVYDKERTIIDVIHKRKSIDSQIFIQAVKDYFKGKPNLRKILKYAKLLNMEQSVRDYIEIL